MTGTAKTRLVRVPPREAEPGHLAEALRTLCKASCGECGDVSRTLTMNFVGVALAADAALLREATDRLIRRSPARAFLLSIDDTLGAPRTEVAAVIRDQDGLRDVLLEEIAVRLPRSWFPHVPGLVRPMLVGDLPSHLYWALDWSDDPDSAALRALCDHCVVDSKRFSLPAVQLAKLAERRDKDTTVTDLSWLRLRPWRRALAEAFQRVSWRPGFETRCVLRHGRRGLAAAVLLAQWLESKLDARVELEESAVGEDICPESVTLSFAGHEVAAASDGKRLTVHVTTPEKCFLPFRLPCSDSADGDLLAAAIDIA